MIPSFGKKFKRADKKPKKPASGKFPKTGEIIMIRCLIMRSEN